MTFLNPLALIGLIAAAIPILLHFFNLRKLRTIEFSTLAYIKELQRTKIRRLKLRQLLLLVLRTLLVIFVVLALSRPTLRGSASLGTGTRATTTAVIIIDDSQSMTAANERGELFRQASQQALAVLGLLGEEDDVVVVPLSRSASAIPEDQRLQSRTREAAERQLQELRPSVVRGTLFHALATSAAIFSGSANIQKELYILSDFQESLLETETSARPTETHPEDVRTFVIPAGLNRIHNLGIENLWTENVIIEPGRAVTLSARIVNYGHRPVENHIASLFVQGTRIAQRGMEITPGAALDVTFTFVPTRSGFLEGWIELEDDDLAFDNRRYFAWKLPDVIRITLAGGESDLRYLRLALATRGETKSSFLVRETSSQVLSSSLLSKSDVLVLANPELLSKGQLASVRSFVEAGGGLIYFPGPKMDVATYNSTLATALQLPRMERIESHPTPRSSGPPAPPTEFGNVAFRHPLFDGMFQQDLGSRSGSMKRGLKPLELESPLITRHVRFRSTAQVLPLMTLSDGIPFLLEQQIGGGRIFLFATSTSPEWSNLPERGLFVPLIHQSISYLSRSGVQQFSTIAGEEIVLRNLPLQAEFAAIRGEIEVEEVIPISHDREGKRLQFIPDDHLGIFTVEVGSEPFAKLAVNMDPLESRMARADEERINKLLAQHGIDGSSVATLTDASDLQRIVTEARYGTELWKSILIAAFVVALSEMFVARTGRREAEKMFQLSAE